MYFFRFITLTPYFFCVFVLHWSIICRKPTVCSLWLHHNRTRFHRTIHERYINDRINHCHFVYNKDWLDKQTNKYKFKSTNWAGILNQKALSIRIIFYRNDDDGDGKISFIYFLCLQCVSWSNKCVLVKELKRQTTDYISLLYKQGSCHGFCLH